MTSDEAGELYSAALDSWEQGDDNAFIDYAGAYNSWLQDEGYGPMMPSDWYPENEDMQEAMWEWIDTLSHDEREEFFGY